MEEEEEAPKMKKRKVSATTTKTVEKEIEGIKEKVRLLALQNNQSEALILLSLDELAKTARSAQVEEADIYEELYRQASRNQGQINLVNLVLSVMGGKASDVVAKALSKCRKEQEDSKELANKTEKQANSPLQNLYQPPFPQPFMMPYQQGYGYPFHTQFAAPGYTGRPRYQRKGGPKQIGPCLFCDAMGHLIKDCLKFKAMKEGK